MITTINPATGQPGPEFATQSLDDIQTAIRTADRAWHLWRDVRFSERAAAMRRVAEILRGQAEGYARLMAMEMGKPVSDGRAEIEKCAWVCEFYAANAEQMLQPRRVETDADASIIAYRPLGLVLAIMPWNYPFWQVFRAAAPNLMAGNGLLLKHAPNVPGCANAIAAIFRDAGFPDGLFTSLLIDPQDTDHLVQEMIARPEICGVTLTGSVAAGRRVGAAAGQHIKKSVLELGGSDPYLVLEDADVDAAVSACVTSRMTNSGQSCIGAKRLIVAEGIIDRFQPLLVEKMASYTPGDPLDDTTTLGPLARLDLRDRLHRQVADSVAAGARPLLGGAVPDRPGAWYPPTVLTDVRPGMPAYDEELFGPAAVVISAPDEEAAIRIANDNPFGLGAAVFTRSPERGLRIAGRLEAGNCFINTFVRSDPRLPFGGVKHSGYGRELGTEGIREFVNVCTVVVG